MSSKLLAKLRLINLKLLPVKAHYFCYAAGISGVIPFLPVLAKYLGFSANVLGLFYTVLPFVQFFSKPIISGFADRFHKHKTVMLVSIAILTMSLFSIYFIPELTRTSDNSTYVSQLACNPKGSKFLVCRESKDHFDGVTGNSESLQCNATCSAFNTSISLCDIWNVSGCGTQDNKNQTKIVTLLHRFHETRANICSALTVVQSKLENSDWKDGLQCAEDETLSCVLDSCDSGTRRPEITLQSAFNYYQFWWLLFSMIVGWIALGGMVSVTDAVAYNILGDDSHLYGLQRLWATAGWGSIIVVTGFLNNIATINANKPTYSPGFFLFLGFLCCDMLSISRLEVKFTAKPSNVTGNINQILRTPKVSIFICVVLCVGIMTGILESFLFWYLTDLGAHSQLLGLSRGVQCYGAELPAFVISGWVMKRLGHVNAMSLVLFVFGFRFICYSFLVNPWWTLPIELCHGVTFGIYYTSMTSYASDIAPPGLSTTLQGLVGCVYEGIGVAFGSFTGGFIYAAYGGSRTFRIYGLFGLLMCLLHMAAQRILNRHQNNIKTVKDIENSLPEEKVKMLKEEQGNVEKGSGQTQNKETTKEDKQPSENNEVPEEVI